jgi:50S ribosomal protein L16 3-hydroxylase
MAPTTAAPPIDLPTPLLGGLSPQVFMRRHWQKRPLLIRQALPGSAFINRAGLMALAARDDVESRAVIRQGDAWSLRHGPFGRRALPPARQPGWTLLVQGMDLHLDAGHQLLQRFRFAPDARLDDAMVSWASDGGGVGPHFDSYDVFLLQMHGRRRWRIGRLASPELEEGVPLKILRNFRAEQEWLLEPGDMLYLPPRWAHDGIADGECMTCSIGFRAAPRRELAREVLQRVLDAQDEDDAAPSPLYADPSQPATAEPGRIPPALQSFAAGAVRRVLNEPDALACALGEVLSEPKPGVWFEAGGALPRAAAVSLDRRSRMVYDDRHVFINGEAFRAAGRDARLMRRLSDTRALAAGEVAAFSPQAAELLATWCAAGWLHAVPNP